MAAAIHELGHYFVLRILGAHVLAVRLSVLGAVMETDGQRLSYGRELAAVLAGPAANLACAVALSAFTQGTDALIGVHLVLGMFNLLPIRPLDGGCALYLMVAWLKGPAAGERAAGWVGIAAATVLAAGLCFLMWDTGGSLWLLPAAIGLVAAAFQEFSGKTARIWAAKCGKRHV